MRPEGWAGRELQDFRVLLGLFFRPEVLERLALLERPPDLEEPLFFRPPALFFRLELLERLEDFFAGTLAPFLRASERPIAMACFRLVTFLPLPPLFRVPRFFLRIALSTVFPAFSPYLATESPLCRPGRPKVFDVSRGAGPRGLALDGQGRRDARGRQSRISRSMVTCP